MIGENPMCESSTAAVAAPDAAADDASAAAEAAQDPDLVPVHADTDAVPPAAQQQEEELDGESADQAQQKVGTEMYGQMDFLTLLAVCTRVPMSCVAGALLQHAYVALILNGARC
jgi:hypothetical protein